jgi:hypothetical protein
MRLPPMILFALLVDGCARYEQRDFFGGFAHAKVSAGRYVVTGEASWFNDIEDGVVFAYWHAQDLCRNIGFNTFVVETDRRPGNDCILVVRCTNDGPKSLPGSHPERDAAVQPWSTRP